MTAEEEYLNEHGIPNMPTQLSKESQTEIKDTAIALKDYHKESSKELVEALWHSVENRPLFTKDERGHWICTEDGDGEFIAALPYNDSKRPNEDLWWIRHCVVEDEIGLCVVGDDYNEPAGWNLEDVTHWMPMPSPPACR